MMSHSTLHTVNQSPFEHGALAQCLCYAQESDAILLLENGVYAALNTQPLAEKLMGKHCYAIEADINARGLSNKLATNIQLIDFTDFVRLSVQYKRVQSWY